MGLAMKSIVRLAWLFVLVPCACDVGEASAATTFYVVRHTERVDQSKDSPLSPRGLQRAESLRDDLAEVNNVTSAQGVTFVQGPLAQACDPLQVITDPSDSNNQVIRQRALHPLLSGPDLHGVSNVPEVFPSLRVLDATFVNEGDEGVGMS